MARSARSWLLFLMTAWLAGCAEGEGAEGGEGEEKQASACLGCPVDPCPDATATSTVEGFTAHGGQWAAGGDGLLCGEGAGAVNSLVGDDTAGLADFEASLDFRLLQRDAPEYDAGAGIVIHFKDDENFQIIRYSPREQGWHLFTMTGGERVKQEDATVAGAGTHPGFGDWATLRVTSVAGNVTAFHGATKVIEYTLPAEASREGGVGYFLRASQAAEFQGLSAIGL